jgi:hypothetical protein
MQQEMYSGIVGIVDSMPLRVREMEYRTTATLSTSSRFLALPENFIEARRAELEYSSSVYPLRFVPAISLREIASSYGLPTEFTVTSQIEFNITPDVAYTMELQYFGEVGNSGGTPTPLTSSNTTHSVLTKHPSIYLYGCLYQVEQWLRNTEKAAYYGGLFQGAINQANSKSNAGRYGPAPQAIYEGCMP